MKLIGLIKISSPIGAERVLLGEETWLWGIYLGRCVVNFTDEVRFDFEGDADLGSLTQQLVTARKAGHFSFWSFEWYLLDEANHVVNRGLTMEDPDTGEIINHNPLGNFDGLVIEREPLGESATH